MFSAEGQDSASKERLYHATRAKSSPSIATLTESILRDMEVIDSKSVGLLQFVSMLLAALTFSLGFLEEGLPHATYIRSGIEFFLTAFALAAWISLRSLNIINPGTLQTFDQTEEFESYLIEEITRRLTSYMRALKLVRICMTLLVVFVVSIMVLRLGVKLPT